MNRKALTLALAGLLVLFGAYFGFRFRGFVTGGAIAIDEPAEGAHLISGRVLVRGEGRDVARLELDGRPIYLNQFGEFQELLLLAPGLNIIELKAEGHFGRALSVERMVMVDASSSSSSF